MKVIPKKSFLLRQEDGEGHKKKDVYAWKGKEVDLPEKEIVRFWGGFDLTEAQQKKLMPLFRKTSTPVLRVI